VALATDIWETIAAEAERESTLWGAALRAPGDREPHPVFSPLGDERFALGLETIYEGYLLHYGRPRLFTAPDRDTSVLLGDYLYAHGLVRIAGSGNAEVVSDLAELLSLCAHLRAESGAREDVPDGIVWAATVAALGAADGRLAQARVAMRERAERSPLADLAEAEAGAEAVGRALARHRTRILAR
jgi:hypothetical protein